MCFGIGEYKKVPIKRVSLPRTANRGAYYYFILLQARVEKGPETKNASGEFKDGAQLFSETSV